MSAKEHLKKEWKTEKTKLKEMSFKDKIWYIWEYYKFHMLGILLIGGIISVVATSIYRGTFETELYCMYINNKSSEELNTDILTKDFHAYMSFTEKQVINAESAFVSTGEKASEFDYATMAKITALVASRELDLMISDVENFNHYASLSGFLNLEQVLPADVMELVKDRLVYGTDESGTPYACGISLDGTKFAEISHLDMDDITLAILSNSKNTENCFDLLRYIFAL